MVSDQQETTNESECHVLLVDDDAEILEVLSRSLHSWAKDRDAHIVLAESGEQALQFLERYGENIWIMLSDLKMPRMSGVELLKKTSERYPLLVSFALTGGHNLVELSRTVSAGIFGYIPKPWESDALIAELDRALEHAKAKRDSVRHMRALESELRWAGELQQQLLEVEVPVREGLITYLEYRPLPWLSCGGDYYDVIPYGDDSVIVLIGDVAGHGVKAAFVTAVLKSIIYRGYVRESLRTGFSPAEFLHWLNARFLEEFAAVPDVILTFSATLLNHSTGRLTTAGGGHEALFIQRSSGWETVGSSGPALGISPEATFAEQHLDLDQGDMLTFLTDGAIEYPKAGRKLSINEVTDVLSRYPSPDDDTDQLLADLRRAAGMSEHEDDVTIIRAKLL